MIQHVREKMTCRDCEKISEPPVSVPRATAVELATGERGGLQGRLKSADPAVLTECLVRQSKLVKGSR